MSEVRHPVVVLEGADGSGKTTLARSMCRQFGARYVHMTWRQHSTPRQFFNYQMACTRLALRLAADAPVVLDRWWPSEEVYGPHFRQKVENQLAWRLLDRVGLRYGLHYVFCLPSDLGRHLGRHAARSAEGGEMYDSVDGVPQRYRALHAKLLAGGPGCVRSDVSTYDVDRWALDEVDQAAHLLLEHACDLHAGLYGEVDSRARSWALESTDRTFVGSPSALVTVAADFSTGVARPRQGAWPGCSYYDASQHALLHWLERAGVREEEVVFLDTAASRHWSSDIADHVFQVCASPAHRLVDFGVGQSRLGALGLSSDLRLAPLEFYESCGDGGYGQAAAAKIGEVIRGRHQ